MECTEIGSIEEIRTSLIDLHGKVDGLAEIKIEVTNGKTKTVKYDRTEFFQMLYDRKDTLKNNMRTIAKDVILFGGVVLLILDRFLGVL